MKVKELLDKPEKWTQGWFARNERGLICNWDDIGAKCYCLMGSLALCYNNPEKDSGSQAIQKLSVIIKDNYGTYDIVRFNDDPKTTFNDIRKVLELADV